MSALSIQPTFPIFTDTNGLPLENGYIWIGAANLDPQGNPIAVYWDAALTIAAAQPIRTLAGYPSRNGTPARVYVNSDYSIRVQDKNASTVYSAPQATERISSDLVTFTQAGSGAVQRTAEAKLRESVSVKDFGAVGDGVTDDTAAIQNAANAAQNATLFFPSGTYICANVTLPANITLTGNAVIKLKALPSLNFSPIFTLSGSGVYAQGLKFDGNRSNQPANGFSDSWAGGPNGTGKSNRAAFFSTATASDLVVENCEFSQFYAGSIALRNWSRVTTNNCYFHDSNCEAVVYNLGNTNSVQNLKVVGCNFRNIATGDATVNANCVIATLADGVVVQNNDAANFERNLVKLETCSNAIVNENKIASNTLEGFNVIQAQTGGTNIVISNNILSSVKRGILVESGSFVNISIIGNILKNVASSSGAPDGIRVAGATDVVISDNIINEVTRNGIYVSDNVNLSITGNAIYDSSGTAVGPAIRVDIDTGINGRVYSICNNVCNGKQDVSDGVISIGGAGTYEAISICGNSLKGRSATNSRGFWSNSSAVFTNGILSNNILASDCNIEMYPGTGSMLQVINNMTPRVVNPAGAFARIVGNGAAPPVSGAFWVGDILLSSAPAAGGNIGWVCTTAGTPGTWKTFGAIAA